MTTDAPTPEAKALAALAQALKGRTASPDVILDCDVSQFVVGDAVHASRIAQWVEQNTKPKPAAGPRSTERFRPQPEAGINVGRAEAERRFGPR